MSDYLLEGRKSPLDNVNPNTSLPQPKRRSVSHQYIYYSLCHPIPISRPYSLHPHHTRRRHFSHWIRVRPSASTISLKISTTYPEEWTGKLLLNVSPSSPVNALALTEIRVVKAEHDLDYPIDMPEEVNMALQALDPLMLGSARPG